MACVDAYKLSCGYLKNSQPKRYEHVGAVALADSLIHPGDDIGRGAAHHDVVTHEGICGFHEQGCWNAFV